MQRFLKIAFLIAAVVGLTLPVHAQTQPPAEPAPEAPVDTAAIEAIKESNPTTPQQLINAALLTGDLGRADLSKQYLQKLLLFDFYKFYFI